jgi:hypothetical protein
MNVVLNVLYSKLLIINQTPMNWQFNIINHIKVMNNYQSNIIIYYLKITFIILIL